MDILRKNLNLLEPEERFELPKEKIYRDFQIVAIGSSTGGPAALQIILTRLPAEFPAAIVISQHMPRGFTGPLSERLNKLSKVNIIEAADGDPVEAGTVLICPGGYHLSLNKKGQKIIVSLKEGRLTDKYIPSVDLMMTSVAHTFGANAMGVILTGMGNDGKKGMLEIKAKGGYTISESEESAVVFGMPAEAIKANAVESIIPILEIPSEIVKLINN
jgi:two-component system chemotaxis response regulator CheB